MIPLFSSKWKRDELGKSLRERVQPNSNEEERKHFVKPQSPKTPHTNTSILYICVAICKIAKMPLVKLKLNIITDLK